MTGAGASGTVACIAECMIELAPAGAGLYRRGFAGDTFNTAWYLRALLPPDWQVNYVTAVGADAVSDEFMAFLAADCIGTDHISRISDRTMGLYMIAVRQGERSFSYWRAQSAARLLARDPAALTAALAGVRLACFSGITLAILSAEHRANLLEALRAVRARGDIVAFDPNIRTALWPDAGEMRAILMRGHGVASISLPTHDDEVAAFGDACEQATLERIAAAGPVEVVLKNGPDAAWCLVGGATQAVPALPGPAPVDTTGAGDSFNAAYLAARLTGKDPVQALQDGHALARRVIGQPGALIRL